MSYAEIIASALEVARSATGESVSYDDGVSPVTVTAVRGQLQDDQDELLNVMDLTRNYVDWLIAAADLNGEPKSGDAIRASGVAFEAIPLGGQPVWRYSDPGRTQYRIHTQEVGDAG